MGRGIEGARWLDAPLAESPWQLGPCSIPRHLGGQGAQAGSARLACRRHHLEARGHQRFQIENGLPENLDLIHHLQFALAGQDSAEHRVLPAPGKGLTKGILCGKLLELTLQEGPKPTLVFRVQLGDLQGSDPGMVHGGHQRRELGRALGRLGRILDHHPRLANEDQTIREFHHRFRGFRLTHPGCGGDAGQVGGQAAMRGHRLIEDLPEVHGNPRGRSHPEGIHGSAVHHPDRRSFPAGLHHPGTGVDAFEDRRQQGGLLEHRTPLGVLGHRGDSRAPSDQSEHDGPDSWMHGIS